MKAIKDIVMREVAGETVLIPVERAALRLHGMISMSESGTMLWKLLEEHRTREELIQAILAEYEVEEATASADVDAFIAQMDALGLLEH